MSTMERMSLSKWRPLQYRFAHTGTCDNERHMQYSGSPQGPQKCLRGEPVDQSNGGLAKKKNNKNLLLLLLLFVF